MATKKKYKRNIKKDNENKYEGLFKATIKMDDGLSPFFENPTKFYYFSGIVLATFSNKECFNFLDKNAAEDTLGLVLIHNDDQSYKLLTICKLIDKPNNIWERDLQFPISSTSITNQIFLESWALDVLKAIKLNITKEDIVSDCVKDLELKARVLGYTLTKIENNIALDI